MYRTVLGIQEMVVCVFSVQYSVTGMMVTALTAHIDDSRTSICICSRLVNDATNEVLNIRYSYVCGCQMPLHTVLSCQHTSCSAAHNINTSLCT